MYHRTFAMDITVWGKNISTYYGFSMKLFRTFLVLLLSLTFLLLGCQKSEVEDDYEESEKKHRGVDFLPPVKEYKDRASGAAAAVEGKGKEVHRQFEMLDN